MSQWVKFSRAEVELMVVVLAGLTAEKYKHPSVRALIYRCKAIVKEIQDNG